MNKKPFNRKPELLAPAGDLARAKVAIRYGADAIYIGGQQFSLRARASNFTMDDIKEICAYAKEYGARVHVTVNMIPHDKDFDGLETYLKQLESYGVSAIIVASPWIMSLAKKVAPGLEVHCSTQLSVTNTSAVSFLSETLHIDRVVLARECTMDEVYAITENSPIDTETFIHGGMCVNYSGRCTLSNRMTLRDANRGGCAQSCRWQYHLYHNNQEISNENDMFTMGSKDLMCINEIYDLMRANVASFKIEGRMKTEYYIASVVHAYRNLIDEIYENQAPLSDERMAYYLKEIQKGENRATWPGFYHNQDGEESIIFHPNSDAQVNHDYLASVLSYDKENHIATIQTRNRFAKEECLELLSPLYRNKEFYVDWMKNDKGEMLEISRSPMTILEIPIDFDVQVGDIIRRAGK